MLRGKARKLSLKVILLCAGLAGLISVWPASGQVSFKGMELYSYREEGAAIKYALFPGTNRNRYEPEIVEAGGGLDVLIEQIKQCAAGETIFWFNNIGKRENVKRLTFVYPEKKIIDKIKLACRVRKITLVLP